MKVVLFCGGLGTRLRDYSEAIPKPMVKIGYRPILWNIMKYYAHFGHTDFILALGYKADVIKDYFGNYDETISNDFVFSKGGKDIQLKASDIDDWTITFVDTGAESNIGQRLMCVREHLGDDKMFLANYADGLSNLDLNAHIEAFRAQPDKVAAMVTYSPVGTFHLVSATDGGLVTSIEPMSATNQMLNTGYFVLRNEIFDHMNYGEELVFEPFQRLIAKKMLIAHQHNGFWMAMDTFKDKMALDEMYEKGQSPWEVWKKSPAI